MHELYLESDRVRDELLSKTAEYFNKFWSQKTKSKIHIEQVLV
jgi:hypothetical protein